MAAVCAERRPGKGCDFALAPGDLIYDDGVAGVDDPKFRSHFETPFQDLGKLPFWSVPGNHDWHAAGSVQAQIDYTTRSERWRMPFNHFSIPRLPEWLHIYGVDTAVMDDIRRASGEDLRTLSGLRDKQLQAAREALCGKSGWRLLFGHHPVYSSGQHGWERGQQGKAPHIAAALEPLIGGCAVQVYFAGHDHMQEHISVEKPRYQQIIQGAGAEFRTNSRRIRIPGTDSKFLAEKLGFALVTAGPKEMKVEFFAPGESAPVYTVPITP